MTLSPEEGVVLSAAISTTGALGVAVFNWFSRWFSRRGRERINYETSLSASEARFRQDVLTRLTKVQQDYDEMGDRWRNCEARHLECEERNDRLERRVRELEERLV